MGTYRIFAHEGLAIGGMMTRQPQCPVAWSYYVAVPALDAAVDRIALGGGTVIFGPQEVPGPAYIVNATDPQGAHFSLVAPTREGGGARGGMARRSVRFSPSTP